MISTVTDPLVIALDSNIFLSVLLPQATKSGPENVRGAERILSALDPGVIIGITTAMTLAEIRWAFARSGQGDYLQAYHTLTTGLADRLHIISITPALAYECGALRAKYYSRSNDMSYVDALCLATALDAGASGLVSSDPHLLEVAELPAIEPKLVPASAQIRDWLQEMRR
jgi:predicted nucleic acid-binding protein